MAQKHALVVEVERGTHFPDQFLELFNFETISKVYLRDVTSEFKTSRYDFVLYACECVNERQLRWLVPFAKQNPHSQFIVLTQQISIHAYRLVASMGNIITLQLPLSEEILKNIVGHMTAPSASSDIHRFPRFLTDEPVRMVVMETGLLIPSRMKNYSVSGAFIEYKGIHLRVGHNLKVNLPQQVNPDTNKKLQLDGRVVWIRAGENRSSSSGIGVQFIEWILKAS